MSGVYIKGMEMPTEGFIEVLIQANGVVQKTGYSRRYEGQDYYSPWVGEVPETYTAVSAQDYDELLKAAKAMHTWIFLNTWDEQQAYDECHLSDEMNAALGYGGQFVFHSDPPKGEE